MPAQSPQIPSNRVSPHQNKATLPFGRVADLKIYWELRSAKN